MPNFKTFNRINNVLKFSLGILFLMLSISSGFAQLSDSAKSKTDTLKPIIPIYHSPRKAALFSTVIPGLGQAYNKKYWKIPVIYAGAAGLAYSFNVNQKKYVNYRTAYKYRIDDDPLTIDDYVGKYTDESLNSLQNYYHRFRDLSAIGIATLYLLNILDASVDAHLFTFDVSDDLTLNLRPAFINTANVNHYTTGLSLNIKF